jgi:nicotinamidase/pyrazinamidase
MDDVFEAEVNDGHAALLVVDVQNDFCSGGVLAVPGSDRVVDSLNGYIQDALARAMPIYASREWHPARSTHFAPYGGMWPVHCVQDSPGAQFHPSLRLPPTTIVISKGQGPDAHGYSAFEGRTPDGTALLERLRNDNIAHLYVGGLATDYCVRASVLDARSAGLNVTLLQDAIAGVDRHTGDSSRAIAEMRRQGVSFRQRTGSPID